jgi:hypothetical protein
MYRQLVRRKLLLDETKTPGEGSRKQSNTDAAFEERQ